ncbi:hypothetical protein Tco_1008669 [Tanacetum coccineum]
MRKTTSQILDPPTLWSVWVVWLQRMWPKMVEGDRKELHVAVGWPEMVLFVVDMMYIWLVKDKEIWAMERWWSIMTVEWLVMAVEQVGVEQVVVKQSSMVVSPKSKNKDVKNVGGHKDII